jgi:hypothetical protein
LPKELQNSLKLNVDRIQVSVYADGMVTNESIRLAPDWHPLAHIDQFILACGWTHDGEGFVCPEQWAEAIAIRHGRGKHWRREHAIQFCVRYHEQLSGFPLAKVST